MSNGVQHLLVRGVAAAKAKEYREARFYFERALNSDPTFDQQMDCWLWLSDISQDVVEKRGWLENVLVNNPGEPRARRKLAVLEGRLKPDDMVNPDKMTMPVGQDVRADGTRRFMCLQCGAALVYAPDGQNLVCEHCSSEEGISTRTNGAKEEDFILALATARGHQEPVNRRVFNCQGCGMEFVLPPQMLSATCPYCESTHVVNHDRAIIPPGGIIPFSVNRQEAQESLKYWFKDHSLNPVGVKGVAMYVSAWLFNLTGTITWRGWQEDRNRLDPVEGRKSVDVFNVLVPGGLNGNRQIDNELLNFDLKAVAAYDERYLANITAETYQVSVADASLQAREQILRDARVDIVSQIKGYVRDFVTNSAGMYVDSFKLVLFPIWVAHYTSDDERFHVVVNGQTAHVSGERAVGGPAGWLKSWRVG